MHAHTHLFHSVPLARINSCLGNRWLWRDGQPLVGWQRALLGGNPRSLQCLWRCGVGPQPLSRTILAAWEGTATQRDRPHQSGDGTRLAGAGTERMAGDRCVEWAGPAWLGLKAVTHHGDKGSACSGMQRSSWSQKTAAVGCCFQRAQKADPIVCGAGLVLCKSSACCVQQASIRHLPASGGASLLQGDHLGAVHMHCGCEQLQPTQLRLLEGLM